MTSVPSRAEIPADLQWNIHSIFESDAAWETALQEVQAALPEMAAYQGSLGQGPAQLLAWYHAVEPVLQATYHVYVYASCRYSVDTMDQTASAMTSRAGGLYGQVLAAVAFAEPEILAIDPALLESWLADEPALAIYRHALEQILARKAHVRSAEVEEVLGQVMDALDAGTRSHSILAEADLRFAAASTSDDVELAVTQGSLDAMLVHDDRQVRRTAWESYADAHLAVKNTIANCIEAGAKQHLFEARTRRYESCLQAALEPRHIPADVYHNVLDTFGANLPTWHRYWRLRRLALGYDQLYEYDIKAPLATSPTVPFDQAMDWICDGLAPLGQDYVNTLRDGVYQHRWVDRAPNQGKAAGAFSTGVYGTQPFVLMSYTDDVFSLSTLAHELGHSMHSHSSWANQPFVYGSYGIFVAEVASNLNQALVRQHLLETSDDRAMQIALIEEAMANFHRYFFIMPTLARYELAIHQQVEQGQGLTADGMIELLADLFAEGYGDEVVLERQRTGITWAEFHTHLYANFYVYQYTTGIAGAHALAHRVLTEGQPAVDDYLAYLRAGSSAYPLDVLRAAGVDLTTPEPIQHAFDAMASMIDRLAALLGVEE